MFVRVIPLMFVGITCGYNIDVDFPIVLSYKGGSNNGSYFGYTVHLYHEPVNGTSWLIVGAPKGNYSSGFQPEPGVAYRCLVSGDNCVEIKPQVLNNEKEYLAQLQTNIIIKKQHGWFGGAIDVDQWNGILTVCAPRTIVTVMNSLTNMNLDTMQGMCYSGKISSNELRLEDRDLKYHDFKTQFWYNPLHGFSIHYALTRYNEDRKALVLNRIVGQPKHENYGTADIIYLNRRMQLEEPLADSMSQLGYSVESGYFFKRDQLLFVCGAPGWHYVGLVAVINPAVKGFAMLKVHGTETGEYFGASLAVGDLNNDGLDDLLVGAPYWGEDNGKVYIYLGTNRSQFDTAVTLQGHAEGGHFGYTIASGDLDADGFHDIIVGAPWEEDGVIYIYNGAADLADTYLQVSQRIEAKKLLEYNPSQKMQRFGFSISRPVDIDENGYLDIAVGAYKSQHVVILRSKPLVKTDLSIEIIPDTLQRDAKQFSIKLCQNYTGYYVQRVQEIKITVIIDEQYQRTKETVLELRSDLTDNCLSVQINISRDVRDFIEPISIFARHDFVYDNASGVFCEFCPIERKNNKQFFVQALLPFNIGCGDDKVCNSNITASARFHNVRDNNVWVIGSSDISLEVSLRNDGEPAYLTTLYFTFPEGVILRSILPSCQEDTSKEYLILICEAGNPIWNEEEKSIKLDLDMRHLTYVSPSYDQLYFHAIIDTQSKNLGMSKVDSTINLVNEVSLSLHGKANEEAYYLATSIKSTPNISFQHAYQVYKLGASPIVDAQLIINVPMTIKNSGTLTQMHKPVLYVSGEYYECSTRDALLDRELVDVEEEPVLESDMEFYHDSDESREEDASHTIDKRDLKKSVLWPHSLENIETSWHRNESLNTIYINCTNPDVNCTRIVCDLSALKTLQDVGKVVIKLLLDTNKLKGYFGDDKHLKFSTEARVDIIRPRVRLEINGTRSQAEITTMIYSAPKVEKLQAWIVMVSVLVGLLLLLIIAAILSTLGFFKRKGNQDLTASKSDCATENGAEPEDKSEST